jgi:hypothetical protein
MKYRVARYTNGLGETWWAIQKQYRFLFWLDWDKIGWRDKEFSYLDRTKDDDNPFGRNEFKTKSEACTGLEKMLNSIDKDKKRSKITVQVDDCEAKK